MSLSVLSVLDIMVLHPVGRRNDLMIAGLIHSVDIHASAKVRGSTPGWMNTLSSVTRQAVDKSRSSEKLITPRYLLRSQIIHIRSWCQCMIALIRMLFRARVEMVSCGVALESIHEMKKMVSASSEVEAPASGRACTSQCYKLKSRSRDWGCSTYTRHPPGKT